MHNTPGAFLPFTVREHIRRLADRGLAVAPAWGGGRALPGTNWRVIADSPPSLEQALAADYTGGLAIICGTARFAGGFVVGVDIDVGPTSWPRWPLNTLFAEAGTRPTSWHIFVVTVDRLDGQRDLRAADGRLVAEIKGAGRALRSWPTQPHDKPRGYVPVFFAELPIAAPVLSVAQLASGLSDFLSWALGVDAAPTPPPRNR